MSPRIVALALLLAAASVAAEEKTLYKCRAPDGSTAFQEAPCDGAALDVIPVPPGGTPPPVTLTEPVCIAMAREMWDLNGTVEHTDFSEQGRQRLAERSATLRTQCGAELERSQLAIECAVLRGAVALGANDAGGDVARVRAQHDEVCTAAAIDADIRRHLRAPDAS